MATGSWFTENSWRHIKKVQGESSGAYLFATDSSNVITAPSKGYTKIVCVEYTANGVSGMTTGLRPSNSSYLYHDPADLDYVSIGVDSSGYYAVTNIGKLDFGGAGVMPSYGGIDAYSIHTLASVTPKNYYMAVIGNATNTTDKYFQVNYSVSGTIGNGGWTGAQDYGESIHGHTFLAITSDSDTPHNEWHAYRYYCQGGYTYTFTIQVDCVVGWYEGVLFESGPATSEPDDSKLIYQLNSLYYVHITSNGTDTHGGSGTGTGTYTYSPGASGAVYIVFRTSRNSTTNKMRYASVRVIKHMNVSVNGNGNGYAAILSLSPYTANSGTIVPVQSRIGSYSIAYKFKGFYDEQGNQILNASGEFANYDKKYEYDSTSNPTWYAHWGNTISYEILNPNTSRYVWCTNSPSACSSTDSTVSKITIATNPVRCASGGTVSTSYSHYRGFTVDTAARYLNIPSGLAAGMYGQNTINFSSPSGTNYESETLQTNDLPRVYISAVTVSTYGTPTKPGVSQIKNFPASGVTLTTTNMATYFSVNEPAVQTVTYKNGATRDGAVTYAWSGTNAYIASRGINYTSSAQYVQIGAQKLSIRADGEGSKFTYGDFVTTAKQAANLVTGVYVFVSPCNSNPVMVSLYTSMLGYFVAKYTSGSERDLYGDPDTSISCFITCPPNLSEIEGSFWI